jgi:hypothetical protein
MCTGALAVCYDMVIECSTDCHNAYVPCVLIKYLKL